MGWISLTADIWSDPNMQPFLACIAHWIAKGQGSSALKLKAALIAFHHLPRSHTGVNIITTLLDRAGITDKVCVVQGLQSSHYTIAIILAILHLITLPTTTPPWSSCCTCSRGMVSTLIHKICLLCAYHMSSTFAPSMQQTILLPPIFPLSLNCHSNSPAAVSTSIHMLKHSEKIPLRMLMMLCTSCIYQVYTMKASRCSLWMATRGNTGGMKNKM